MNLLFLVVLVPVVIHLLVRAPARVVDFPSLRFVRVSPMRAARRRLLSDWALLAVRMGVLAAAAAALANVSWFAPWERNAWNARVARAVVVDARVPAPDRELAALAGSFSSTRIDAVDLRDGVRRARAWLAAAPPGRRELVVISDFPLGSIDRLDIDEIPAQVGLRLVRAGSARASTPVESRTARVESGAGPVSIQTLTVSTAEDLTRVRATASPAGSSLRIEETAWGVRFADLAIELLGKAEDRDLIRAAAAAGLQLDFPSGDGPMQPVVLAGPGATVPRARPLCAPWMGDLGRAIAADEDLASAESAGLPTTARADPPWVVVLRGTSGSPLVSLAAGEGEPCTLLVDTAFAPGTVEWPLLVHRVLRARGRATRFERAETLRVAAANLQRLTRAPGEVDARELDKVRGQRRLWWLAVLGLLLAEWWMRQHRRSAEEAREIHEPAA
jgi:hypothetical protein